MGTQPQRRRTKEDRDGFGLRSRPVRLLFTGDIASEGVNLQHHCHLMIHYDLPWSLIGSSSAMAGSTWYGQVESPQFRALILPGTSRARAWRKSGRKSSMTR